MYLFYYIKIWNRVLGRFIVVERKITGMRDDPAIAR